MPNVRSIDTSPDDSYDSYDSNDTLYNIYKKVAKNVILLTRNDFDTVLLTGSCSRAATLLKMQHSFVDKFDRKPIVLKWSQKQKHLALSEQASFYTHDRFFIKVLRNNGSKFKYYVRETLVGQVLAKAFPNQFQCYHHVDVHKDRIVMTAHKFDMDLLEHVNVYAQNRQFASKAYFKYLEQVLDGASKVLKTLHSLGLVHCDVKPENFLVSGTEVRLADFEFCTYKDAPVANVLQNPSYANAFTLEYNTRSILQDVCSFYVTVVKLLHLCPDKFDQTVNRLYAQGRVVEVQRQFLGLVQQCRSAVCACFGVEMFLAIQNAVSVEHPTAKEALNMLAHWNALVVVNAPQVAKHHELICKPFMCCSV